MLRLKLLRSTGPLVLKWYTYHSRTSLYLFTLYEAFRLLEPATFLCYILYMQTIINHNTKFHNVLQNKYDPRP